MRLHRQVLTRCHAPNQRHAAALAPALTSLPFFNSRYLDRDVHVLEAHVTDDTDVGKGQVPEALTRQDLREELQGVAKQAEHSQVKERAEWGSGRRRRKVQERGIE